MIYALFVFVGFAAGFAIGRMCRRPVGGTLYVDTRDPDGPYLSLSISNGELQEIKDGNEVVFKVQTRE